MAPKYHDLKLKTLKFLSAVDFPAQETATVALVKRKGGNTIAGRFRVSKLDEEMGIVFGWALTDATKAGAYVDLQGDHVLADNDLLKAALEFVRSGANADEMHNRKAAGGWVPFVLPVDKSIAEWLGIEQTGLIAGMQPTAEVFAKFKSGEYTGFSIDGTGERKPVEKSAIATLDLAKLAADLAPLVAAALKAEDAAEEDDEDDSEMEESEKADDEEATDPDDDDETEKRKETATMSDIAKLNAQITALTSERDTLKGKVEAFEKAAADVVVYKRTNGSGIEFRKGDDPRLVAMAKEADEAAEMASLSKRVEKLLKHSSGTDKVKAAVLKAVDGIADEATRTAALEMLAAGDGAQALLQQSVGHLGGGDPESPAAQLDRMAEKVAKDKSIALSKAYAEVLKTADGKRLYAEAERAKQPTH